MRNAQPGIGSEDILRSILPELASWEQLLQSCGKRKDLICGRYIHHSITNANQETYPFLANRITQLYAKCESLEDANTTFSRISERHLDSWNALLGYFIRCPEQGEESYKIFRQIQSEGALPDRATLLSMISVCTHGIHGNLLIGKHIHVQVGPKLSESDVVIGTAIINMYGKCFNYDDSWKTFANMNIRNIISWSSIISICAKCRQPVQALQIFNHMLEEGFLPNTFTFASVLSACSCPTMIKYGKSIHSVLVVMDLECHPYVGNALTKLYSRSGNLDYAKSSFAMANKQEVHSWNIIMAAHVYHGNCKDVITLFKKMIHDKLLPDVTTFMTTLSACAREMTLNEGMVVHSLIVLLGFETNTPISNSLVNMYCKCQSLDIAEQLFREMGEHNLVSWNSLISGYAHNKLFSQASHAFLQMIQEGMSPDSITYTCILDGLAGENALPMGKRIHACTFSEVNIVVTTATVNMYGRCGNFKDALETFHERKVQNIILWNSIFSVCNQFEKFDEVLNLFIRMQKEMIEPSNFTFSSVFSACSSLAALTEGKIVHSLSIEYGTTEDTIVRTALIDMYGKCGSIEDASRIFDITPGRDLVLWTAIICAYAQNGKGKEAIQLFHQMKLVGIVPNKITYVSILSACSHAGLVEEGRRFFDIMQSDDVIAPGEEHYDCMIDLLARSGLLDEAEELMKNMPFEAAYASWTSVLGACRNEGNIDRGKRIGEDMLNLHPEKTSPYIVLSQIYTLARTETGVKTP